MGKTQKKTGKNRLDKYYKLAKEQGYRARSAFKLIQLNKKYSFLETARCCIDLCAAPGGWLQVATKYMPVNSLIVGVDLVPIKPIPRVTTFAADITTSQCRNLLRGELKDWKADVVLHDGAPNVGTAWIQDAYGQSELVVMALNLAVEFLMKGGIFVTKVFRSADYNNLMWVFNQLFEKVEATKPPSSRNVSAEIFVVCRGFLAPKHIDPKFLDPKHVFKELTVTSSNTTAANNAQANVFKPEKKRRQRDGYDEENHILYKTAGATDFVKGSDPISLLGTVNKITFQTEEEKEWSALERTTAEIKALCEDLKVLGKSDFKTLLKWRTALREEIGLDVKTTAVQELTEVVEVNEEKDEEQAIQEELERINTEGAAREKRERRRANETKARIIQRMQLRMTAPMDIGINLEDKGLELGQDDIFDLASEERSRKKANTVTVTSLMDAEEEESDSEEEERESSDDGDEKERKVLRLEEELDGLYNAYREKRLERDAKFKVKESRKKNKAREEEWIGFNNGVNSEDEESEEGGWDKTAEMKLKLGEDDSSDEESEEESAPPKSGSKRPRDETTEPKRQEKKTKLLTDFKSVAQPSKTAQLWFAQDMFKDIEDGEDVSDGSQSDASVQGEDENENADADDDDLTPPTETGGDDIEVVPLEQEPDDMWNADQENEDETKQEIIKKYGLITPEAVTLAQQLVNREKTKTQFINEGFNRYSFNSKDDLPAWFLDDEAKHYKVNLPVTKEAMAALRAKQRALDARPIKKVAEAKARKKHRAAVRLEKAMKKAEGITETKDMSEREKAAQIEKLLSKGAAGAKAKKAREKVKVVVAKGAHKGLRGRPKGVKGRYVMVDSRMKKELRATKRKEKANKKRKRT